MTGDRAAHPAAPPTSARRVLFVTPSLRVGGAEVFLVRLSEALREECSVIVANLGPEEALGDPLRDVGVEVVNFGAIDHRSFLMAIGRLRRLVVQVRPEALQGWMYLGDIAVSLVALTVRGVPAFGSVRMTSLPPGGLVRTRLVPKLAAFANRAVMERTISCDETASAIHSAHGYPIAQIVEIPNIVPELTMAGPFRKPQSPKRWTVGMAARYDEGKGHVNLALAVERLAASGRPMVCRFAGRDCEPGGRLEGDLASLIPDPQAEFIFEGVVSPSKMAEFYSRLDTYVMASTAWEGFPNALAEAVASGIPSLATDVGSARLLVPTNRLMPSGEPQVIADSLAALMDLSEEKLQLEVASNMTRVLEEFSAEKVSAAYMAVWFGESLR